MFWPNCPCCGCVDKYDDFIRSNSSNIGGDWVEEAGDWSISSNRLTVASANAVAVYALTPSHDSYTVSLAVHTIGTGATFRIYLRQDSDNYIVGEVKNSSAGDAGYLRIISCVSGVETIVSQIGGGQYDYYRLIVDDANGVVAFGSADTSTSELQYCAIAYASPPGNQVAIGSGPDGTPSLSLSDFAIWKPSGADCPESHDCCQPWPREEVQLELTGLSNTISGGYGCSSCTSLHGTYTLTIQGIRGATRDGSGALAFCMTYVVPLDGSVCGVRYILVNLEPYNSEIRLSRNEWGELQTNNEFSSAFADYDVDFDGCGDGEEITSFGKSQDFLCKWASTYNSSVVTIL